MLRTSLKEISRLASRTAIRIAVNVERGNLKRAAQRLGITDRAVQMRRAAGDLEPARLIPVTALNPVPAE